MVATTEKRYTVAEYFQLEETATDRHEYRDGEIIIMTGGTPNHNRIAGNFYRRFPLTIQNQAYDIFITDLRLAIPAYNMYTYPDIMIVKGEPILERGRTDTITNPQVIIEVLSKSTQDYNRGDKFKFYRSLNSFEEYILIDQYGYYIEQFHKRGDHWEFRDYHSQEAILTLFSLDFQISLTDLYQRVDFTAIEVS
ncbi:MAG: Uma2 family endonuclease [Microcystis aeruginosa K13-05]|jgi:Uma2 family endonuclease|uniref:Uma2 family endonuclease n=1 Tax=unclassified Microcystis TaxID=2643300 RepID=UPI0022C05748|nr:MULTISPECIES: Uma2 family endonuclease [unclassified Microcystis]MCZ8047102.1 Uma2 family endonuclease [Microcystis sp. LE19-41.2A]MCZ8289634.1 Uma2 family endonuclease [Microcystis sp. LE19-59.1C]NCR79106.1 Uma2 family endonuclease [Microcystis aeruginosa K13-10]NCR83695.1 Uma2 family endonuclease [Microcystis aeruginosa K13-05]